MNWNTKKFSEKMDWFDKKLKILQKKVNKVGE